MAAALSVLAADAVEAAKSGHPGMPMGMADVATVLFTKHMVFDAGAPDWPDRDRFVLSAGHGSMLLYGLLHLLGYEDMTLEEIKQFRQIGAKTAGHPEYGHAKGIETTTGPLGQGLANAVGMAIAEAHLAARFGADLVNHYTYVIAGDGCLMEGISQEALSLAGHLRLNKLIVLWDDNGITIDGKVSVADRTDQLARFKASGWATLSCDGHDPDAIDAALTEAKSLDAPVLIACKTTIGRGAPQKAGTAGIHGAPLGADELAGLRKALSWEDDPFVVPDDIVGAWRAAGTKGRAARSEWEARLEANGQKEALTALFSGDTSSAQAAVLDYAARLTTEDAKPVATRKASQNVLEVINETTTLTMGGSADLTGSNNTKTGATSPFTADSPAGRYLHYGIREHAMAAAMNGMALHGGVLPYGGTFLVFSDYMRGAMRLSALMGIQVIYVLTHDSIGLGEDGPTHQPVEHLASLRAMPNMTVLRPADAVETAEAWAVALGHRTGPTALALTRQNLPLLRGEAGGENRTARGGYVLAEAAGAAATIIATGSEVEIAVDAAKQLEAEGHAIRIVSMPSVDLFASQDETYQQQVLGTAPRVAVEAGVAQGWDRWLFAFGGRGAFVGMDSFGASGPYKDLYQHFGLTAERVAETVRALVKREDA
ncbi:transketolase [Parvularcula bermudensis HTCC2503]|uniref:Transketolase n=1 Tax=Parvularcula bermudensis (strain ATCC BAA-594 / HTCC2503 / KCTC 12087) TaxID=314260 RepID=E0TCN6_PARBH|nr:transketolase [Parvularcula bermudensis]ADM08625.1 transketolase [Parvularcula bermudensis HTCC2503]